MIRLVFIDVDGTLVGRRGDVHPDVAPAIAAARARGLRLALCTGRPNMGKVVELARGVDAEGHHVFHNGACVTPVGASAAGATVLISAMPRASVLALVAGARAHDLTLELYTRDAVYAERRDPQQALHTSLIGVETVFEDLAEVADPVLKAQWIVADAVLPEAERLTAEAGGVELGSGAHAEMPGITFASVTARGASKLTAARWLAAQHGIGLEAVAMIGDGDGDAELVRAAGLGIAMANATRGLRAIAEHVVADVDAGGLAEALHLASSA